MRRDYIVAAILAAAALPIGLPFMVAPMLFPDLSRSTLWLLFFAGPTLVVVLFILAAFVAMDRDPAAKWRRKANGFNRKLVRWTLSASILVLFLTWYLWPTDPLRKDIPGLSIYVLLTQYDVPDFQRKYIFQFGSSLGPRYELFVSASNDYIFSVTDVHGETYPLEMRTGKEGVPLHELVGIMTEVGFTPTGTILRVSVNGKEVSRRTLPFTIDLAGTVSGGNLGSNQNGEQHGNFVIKRLAVWQVALSSDNVANVHAQAEKQSSP